MDESSARFGLPFIMPGQAQKEMFHNEAIAGIDIALHPAVEGTASASPPTAPGIGQCWIVAASASGHWSGHAGKLAAWTSGGWRFITPQPGMCVWDKASGLERRWSGSAWSGGELTGSALSIGGVQVVGPRQPSVPSPSGGSIIDLEARSAVVALTVALRTHGLID
jgi:hypothetical protein